MTEGARLKQKDGSNVYIEQNLERPGLHRIYENGFYQSFGLSCIPIRSRDVESASSRKPDNRRLRCGWRPP